MLTVYWRGFFPSNYIMAEFLALVLRGTGEEEIKKQGKLGFSKNKENAKLHTHSLTLQDLSWSKIPSEL